MANFNNNLLLESGNKILQNKHKANTLVNTQ